MKKSTSLERISRTISMPVMLCYSLFCLFSAQTSFAGDRDSITRHYQNAILQQNAYTPLCHTLIPFVNTDLQQIYCQVVANGGNIYNPATLCTPQLPFYSTDLWQIYCAIKADSGGHGGGGPVKDSAWLLTGNSGTSPGVNYIGTNDPTNIQFDWDGQRIGLLTADAIMWGFGSSAAANGVAIGKFSTSGNSQAIALAYGATANGIDGVSLGYTATSTGDSSTAIGQTSNDMGFKNTNVFGGGLASARDQFTFGSFKDKQFVFFGAMMPGLSAGTSGQLLTSQGANTSPVWSTVLGANLPHVIFTPLTGGTVILVDNAYNIINPATSLATLTIQFPTGSSLSNNDLIVIKVTKPISAVTYTGGTFADPPPVSVFNGGNLLWTMYDLATTSFY